MNIKKRTIDVHIVESNKPSETDAEANALASVLTISGITAHRYYPKTRAELADTFQRIAAHPRCLGHHRHFLPFLHFALHASRSGVFLRGSEPVTWTDLLTLLSPLRERLEGNLLISMSAWFGFYGYQTCVFVGALHLSFPRWHTEVSRLTRRCSCLSRLLSQPFLSSGAATDRSRRDEQQLAFTRLRFRLHVRTRGSAQLPQDVQHRRDNCRR
jgi:hypothetical protein